jgi:hypothetical protein
VPRLYYTVGGCRRKWYPAHRARRSATGARSSLCKHEQVMGTAAHRASVPARTSVSCHHHCSTRGHSRSPRRRHRTGAQGDAIATAQAKHRHHEDAPRSLAATAMRTLPGRQPDRGDAAPAECRHAPVQMCGHRITAPRPALGSPSMPPAAAHTTSLLLVRCAHQARMVRHDARLPGPCRRVLCNGGSRRRGLGASEAWRSAGVPRGGAACHSKPHGAAVCHHNPRGAAA